MYGLFKHWTRAISTCSVFFVIPLFSSLHFAFQQSFTLSAILCVLCQAALVTLGTATICFAVSFTLVYKCSAADRASENDRSFFTVNLRQLLLEPRHWVFKNGGEV